MPQSKALSERLPDTSAMRVVRRLLGITFAGCVVSAVMPGWVSALGVSRAHVFGEYKVHTLLTYSLFNPGLLFWMGLAISFVLSALFIGNLLSASRLWTVVGASALLTGLLYVLVGHESTPLVGAAPVAWGLAGSAAFLGFRLWNELGRLRRLYVVYVIITFFIMLINLSQLAFIQAAIAIVAFVVTGFWTRRDQTLDLAS